MKCRSFSPTDVSSGLHTEKAHGCGMLRMRLHRRVRNADVRDGSAYSRLDQRGTAWVTGAVRKTRRRTSSSSRRSRNTRNNRSWTRRRPSPWPQPPERHTTPKRLYRARRSAAPTSSSRPNQGLESSGAGRQTLRLRTHRRDHDRRWLSLARERDEHAIARQRAETDRLASRLHNDGYTRHALSVSVRPSEHARGHTQQ